MILMTAVNLNGNIERLPMASPAMRHWGTCPLDFQHFHFSSLWSNLTADYPNIV